MRITSIDFKIPYSSTQQVSDTNNLFKLLSEANNLSVISDKSLQANFSNNLAPKTIFLKQSELELPIVSFTTPDQYKKIWSAGNLIFGFNPQFNKQAGKKKFPIEKTESPQPISTKSLLEKLTGNIEELNHSGINFSPIHIKREKYEIFKKEIADRTNLYNYPTGEEWPFIIPATKEEFDNEIKNESINRNPKFEIVYSEYNTRPVIQVDIATKLTKEEVFDLFPDPYGVSYDGLENFFRSIFIDVDWGDVLLRFDIGFGRRGLDFGYWMVKEGGRITS